MTVLIAPAEAVPALSLAASAPVQLLEADLNPSLSSGGTGLAGMGSAKMPDCRAGLMLSFL